MRGPTLAEGASTGLDSKCEKNEVPQLSSGSSFSQGVGCAVPVKFNFLCLVALRAACILDWTLEGTNATLLTLLPFGSGKKDASPDLAPGYKNNTK